MSPADIRGMIARAINGVRLAVRGRLRSLGNQRVMLAQVEALAGERFQGAEMMQQAGFRSRPLSGAEVIVIPLHGSSAHGIVIACANGQLHVANLQDGETAIYNETDGHFIHLKNGRLIQMDCDTLVVNASTKVRMVTPQFEVTGEIKDKCDSTGRTVSSMRAIYNSHTHIDSRGGGVSQPGQGM